MKKKSGPDVSDRMPRRGTRGNSARLACVVFCALCIGAVGVIRAPESSAEQGYRASSVKQDDAAAALEQKRLQLAQKEAALKAKEEALRKLQASLEARINELNKAKTGLEGTLQQKKKADEERVKKMVKIYKALKPDQAGALMDKLDDRAAIELLNQMDQKTAVKLIPYLNQPRVLKWTRDNLAGR